MDLATMSAERDTTKSALERAQTINEQNQTRIHALEGMLGEALRFMDSFEADEAGEIASLRKRLRVHLGKPVTTQGAS